MLRAVLAIVLVAVVVGLAYLFSTTEVQGNRAGQESEFRIEPESRGRVQEPAQNPEPTLTPPPDVPVAAQNDSFSVPGTQMADKVPAPPNQALQNMRIDLPIAGLKAADIVDTFDHARGGGERRHEAVDIMAPRGTPVVAVVNGTIAKVFESKAGGYTIYQFDANQTHSFYYAHLDRYAEGLREGMLVKRGDTIGYVGTSGNADPNAPHLHFAVYELGPEKQWYTGNTPINPYPLLMQGLKK